MLTNEKGSTLVDQLQKLNKQNRRDSLVLDMNEDIRKILVKLVPEEKKLWFN